MLDNRSNKHMNREREGRIMTTKERILEIAYRSFSEQGYDRTSMGSIAKELNITRPALYYHFASKEDLLMATYQMIDPLINVSTDKILACSDAGAYSRELDTLIGDITDNLRDDEQRARFVATVESAAGKIPAVMKSAQDQYNATCDMFKTVIDHGKKIGALPSDLDSDVAKQCLSTYIYGVGDIMLRGSMIDVKKTRAMIIKGLLK